MSRRERKRRRMEAPVREEEDGAALREEQRCEECGWSGKDLRRHRCMRHRWLSETYALAYSNKCIWCREILASRRAVEKHMEKVSKGGDCKGSGTRKYKTPEVERVGRWRCRVCEVEVVGERKIVNHVNLHLRQNRTKDREEEQRRGVRDGATVAPGVARSMNAIERIAIENGPWIGREGEEF